MKIKLVRINNDYQFKTTNERGDVVYLDNSSVEHSQGGSPMDMVLRAVAGCSSIDVVYILRKQQLELDDIQVEVEGIREENAIPKVFTEIHICFKLTGEVPEAKAKRAVDLSMEKYCSVAKMLEKAARIKYKVYLNDKLLSQ